ncbi:MAG TPA: hypothetical protein VM687_02800 [Stenotrophomonas sp.]|nr:hypothetical protein [Stenotrophomonas sp.]
MTILLQPGDQSRSDQPGGAHHQHRGWRRSYAALWRALGSGTCASLCSTVVVSWLSHRRTTAVPAATNATSQWVWGRQAHRRDGWSLRHTLAGYVIHHASSLFWAAGFEWLRRGRRAAAPVATLAAATTTVAYLVDYRVVPPRLSPGFDRRLRRADLLPIYVAFGLGLALPALLGRVGHTRKLANSR